MRSFAKGLAGTVLLGLLWSVPAQADHLVVKRHVTLRDQPARTSVAIDYPDLGANLVLLDDGRKVSGYYHVATGSGREGWIYSSFVERRAGDIAGQPLAAAPPSPATTMAVHFIDVDQGAAALLEFPCGAIMVDAGGRGDAASAHLLDYLNRFFARRGDLNRRLDTIFVTHTHIDHNSNLRAVVEAFDVSNYVDNGITVGSGRVAAKWIRERAAMPGATLKLEGVSDQAVRAGGARGLSDASIDPIACPGVDPKISVLSGSYEDNPGWPDGAFDNGNNQSLVIRVDFGRASFLFTGDMEETALETLVDRWSGTGMLDADVWEVGHHGSHNGTTPGLMAAVTPRLAVISMGREAVHEKWTAWAYGHPRRDAVNIVVGAVSDTRPATTVRIANKVKTFVDYPLAKAVYATGWDGDVTVRADTAGRISVEARQ